MAGLSYGVATAVGSSGFLAVYVTGLVLRRKRRLARALLHFHEGLAAAAEAVLFLMLGLLVFPSRLLDVVGPALVVAGVLMFVARPIAVLLCLPWFRFERRELAVVSWAGLRGAVAIVLATIPLTAGHPDGALVFDVVFVTVLASLVVQAGTVGTLAQPLVGTQLHEHRLPSGSRIAFVVRAGETFVPDGDALMRTGDVLLVAVPPDTSPGVLEAWATQEP